MYSHFRSWVSCLSIALALALPAKSQLLLEISAGEIEGFDLAAGNYGWEFEVTAPIQVGGLALWDEGQDGFSEAHTVGLWTITGSLLASTTFTSGLSASLMGEFRTQDIPVLTLGPGRYRVGGTDSRGGDAMGANTALNGAVTLGPDAFFVAGAFNLNGALSFPETPTEVLGFFGPNIVLAPPAPVAVPEPSAFGLMGVAALASLVWLRGRGRALE